MSDVIKSALPPTRFPEFERESGWQLTTIGAIGNFYYGKSAPKWSLEENAPTPCVRYGELYTKFGAVITETYSRTNIDISNLRFSKGGEILVPRVGEKPEDFGRCCSYLTLKNIAIGEMISVFETEQNPLFYTYYFRNMYKEFAKVVEGQNVKNLYYNQLGPLPIYRPTNLKEQQKIADCLSSLDDLITAQSQKVEALKQHKKGLMQQLFPAEGETFPKLRFPEFENDGEWNNLHLTDIAKTSIGLVTTMTTSYSTKGVPLIRNSDIKQNKVRKEELIYLLDSFADKYPGKKLRTGDIVTVHTGDIGVSSLIDHELNGCLGFATLNTRIIKSDVLPQYLCWYFNSERYISFAISMATGDGRNNFNLSDFNRSVIPVPSKPEQQKISDFLTIIDNLITFQTKSLETLKTHKKGLMQQLFPALDEVNA